MRVGGKIGENYLLAKISSCTVVHCQGALKKILMFFFSYCSISDPIPGMVEDGETKKKLSLRSKEGKILAAPKVIKKQDMAAKPKPGKKVKKVPRDEILISQNDDEE